jgi:hypothetical protein
MYLTAAIETETWDRETLAASLTETMSFPEMQRRLAAAVSFVNESESNTPSVIILLPTLYGERLATPRNQFRPQQQSQRPNTHGITLAPADSTSPSRTCWHCEHTGNFHQNAQDHCKSNQLIKFADELRRSAVHQMPYVKFISASAWSSTMKQLNGLKSTHY